MKVHLTLEGFFWATLPTKRQRDGRDPRIMGTATVASAVHIPKDPLKNDDAPRHLSADVALIYI